MFSHVTSLLLVGTLFSPFICLTSGSFSANDEQFQRRVQTLIEEYEKNPSAKVINSLLVEIGDDEAGSIVRDDRGLEPEAYLTTCEIIVRRGLPCQTHHVTTVDGYILQMHRIPSNGSAVLIQHGLLSSSTDWTINSKLQALPYLLNAAGFDVWLGNSRGNTYSRKHVSLSTSSQAFWTFSWDHMGQFDLPAMVDEVIRVSRQSSINYIGYSQGSLIGFTNFGSNPNLKGKIKKFIALAPVFKIGRLSSALKYLAPLASTIHMATKIIGQNEFLPNNFVMRLLAKACSLVTLGTNLCNNIVFLIAGSDATHLNTTMVPTYLAHIPAGTSTQNVVHFAQLVRTKNCQKFDYGRITNRWRYGQYTPPLYDVSKMDVPVVLFMGDRDKLAPIEDVNEWKKLLPNKVAEYTIATYDHLDFMWGVNANTKVYKYIIAHLD